MNHTSSTAFGLYELFRILIPGFYFTALLYLFYVSYMHQFFPSHPGDAVIVFLFLFFTVIAGLTLYAKETTKRRKAFSENQPSRYLSDKARTMKNMPLLDMKAARQLYLYLLNNHMAEPFHEKIFFFGTVYHIMTTIRRTSLWFSAVGAVAVGFEYAYCRTSLPDVQSLLLFVIGVLLVYLLNVRYNKADRKMQENYQDQIFWLQMNNELVETTLRSYRDVSVPEK
ncbi:MAG: hypothetical protein L0Y80_04020 [Ignavibacteriae bacterium]|nr:hypothetical protein [Ignavibacteriota bacterium]